MNKKNIECDYCSSCTSNGNKIYRYNGELFCTDCLYYELAENEDDLECIETIYYYVGGEYIGNSNELEYEDIIKELIDYGVEIEVVEDE